MATDILHGRVIITWPVPSGMVVPGWGLTVQDADTGEQLLDVTALAIAHGAPEAWDSGPLCVTLTRFVNERGEPSGALSPNPRRNPIVLPTDAYREHVSKERAAKADLPFEGPRFLTGEFRYLIAEMRIAADPAIPTRASVDRGEHTVSQYYQHHGIVESILEAETAAGPGSSGGN